MNALGSDKPLDFNSMRAVRAIGNALVCCNRG